MAWVSPDSTSEESSDIKFWWWASAFNRTLLSLLYQSKKLVFLNQEKGWGELTSVLCNLCAYLAAWVSLDSAGEESSDIGGFKLWWRQLATLSPCPLPNSERSSGARCRRRWPNGGGGSALAALPWAGGRSFIHSFVPSFSSPFIPSFIQFFFPSWNSFIHSFLPSLIYSFIPSIHSLIHSWKENLYMIHSCSLLWSTWQSSVLLSTRIWALQMAVAVVKVYHVLVSWSLWRPKRLRQDPGGGGDSM